MAEPLFREDRGKWYAKVKDRFGVWRMFPLAAKTKTEAREINRQHQVLEDNIRRGVVAAPVKDLDETFRAMVEWWIENTFSKKKSFKDLVGFVHLHVVNSSLAGLPPAEITPGKIEGLLALKDGVLSPASVNHVRAFIRRIFNAARLDGRFHGPCPVTRDVRLRKVPKRKPHYLKREWVTSVLDNVPERFAGIFATGIYGGLRKNEILSMLKSDVDLDARRMLVGKSGESDTTKGGHEDGLPIAEELVPYLKAAIESSPSDLVFPRPDGSRYPEDLDLVSILRTALRKAGIVDGFVHKCRRKGCGHSEEAMDGNLRRCPKCGMKLWPVGKVQPLRFHDTRHTTASLLIMAGANPAAVQAILRHTSIDVTMEFYAHLAPDYLSKEINLLTFRPKADPDGAATAVAAVGRAVAPEPSPEPVPFGSPVVPASDEGLSWSGMAVEESQSFPKVEVVGAAGFEPTTSCTQSRRATNCATPRLPPQATEGDG